MKHMLNKSLEREVDELQVYCVNRGEGCKWIGEKGSLTSHLRSTSGCKYEVVVCPNAKCGEKIERRNYITHAEKCLYRLCRYQYCGHKDTFKAITEGDGSPSHYSGCPDYPVTCPYDTL